MVQPDFIPIECAIIKLRPRPEKGDPIVKTLNQDKIKSEVSSLRPSAEKKTALTRKGGPHREDTNRPRMPTSILGEGPRIRNEGAIKRADIALRLAATRETEGIPQMQRSGRATQGWRDRPVLRNCPRRLRRFTRT